VLRSYKPDLGTDFWNDRFSGGDDSFDLLQLRAADRLRPSPLVPARLVPVPRLDAGDLETRTFELSGQSSINGREMDLDWIDVRARLDTTELWHVRNQGDTPHNFRVHNIQFQVLEYADELPPPRLSAGRTPSTSLPTSRCACSCASETTRPLDPLHVSLPHPPAPRPRADGAVRRGHAGRFLTPPAAGLDPSQRSRRAIVRAGAPRDEQQLEGAAA
jgi:hypothetical protein